MNIKRGDIYYVQSVFTTGSEQRAGRPAIIVSNDKNNHFSSTVEVVYLTTQPKNDLPTHVTIRSTPKSGMAICEQISTVSVERLENYIGHVTEEEMVNLEIAMMISLAIEFSKMPRPAAPVLPAQTDSGQREKELQAELVSMTVRYETLKAMYDSLLAKLLAK